MPKVRLDTLLVERGLAASRERARALVLAGHVRVAGQVTAKAGTLVDPAASLDVVTPDHPYVGRGGLKLAHALDELLRQLHFREGDSGRLEGLLLRLVDLVPPHPELHLREVEDVSLAQRGLPHALAVDERPVRAVEVRDRIALRSETDHGMALRNEAGLEPDDVAHLAADRRLQSLQMEDHPLPVLPLPGQHGHMATPCAEA